ncbi:MAG: RNA polymerase sigma factor [Myxococcota bacterium]
MRDQTDEELMRAYQAGEEQAFRILFDRYSLKLSRLLRRHIWAEEDCRELVQQTFLHLHRARHDFREGAILRPWLYTICLNLKREYVRKKIRRPEAPLELDGRSDPIAHPHDAERLERIRQLRHAVARLPEAQRSVIELHWFHDLPFAEVAQVLGASVTAVKVRAHRGYKKIKTLLEQEERNLSSAASIPQPGVDR